MAWRSLFLSKPCKLRCERSQLVHTTEPAGEVQAFPLEDISVVVADTSQIILTNAVLEQFAQHGIMYMVCDGSHMPSGVFTPYNTHSKVAAVSYTQITATKPLLKRLWQNIIRQKIANQAAVLESCAKPADKLRALIGKVQSGDEGRVEGLAAGIYFNRLFGKYFVRDSSTFVNHCLDYAYAVMRAALARSVAASGLCPWFGIWHSSTLNPFNLVDDLLEPFRPCIDYWVITHIEDLENTAQQLSPPIKASLVAGLNMQCQMKQDAEGDTLVQMALLFAAARVGATLAKAFASKDVAQLSLPIFMQQQS